ncbi:MAG TPA: M20 family metallopeptidase [Gemmatimonadaceae bacterium]|nr:M20 family metallopeptidase [Gemmatimonadaceae bacterium]
MPDRTGGARLPAAIEQQFPDPLRHALVALRRDLHEHPELSFQEHRTADRLHAALDALHPVQLDRVAGTGIVARFRGRDTGIPTVAIRGDIDALPIQEATALAFASRTTGVMHACGHDVHATWTVAAAHLLTMQPAAGDVLVVLQPAEEVGTGAMAMLASGALDGVAAIFGGHVDRRFAVGEVVAEAGPLAASADEFEITLTGSGAHGARPHEAADPIVGAGALIGALQTIVSRRLNPAHAAVVTVGTVHAGSAPNIIPDRATLSGTLRATEPAVRQRLHDEVRRIAASVADTYRLTADVVVRSGPPPIVNPAEPASWARQAATSLLGADGVVPLGFLNMGGEDFACYMERMPGCFLRIGAREPGGEPIPAHSPRFYAAEESIFVGAAVLAHTARIASEHVAASHSSRPDGP